jgi:hypothetical protein
MNPDYGDLEARILPGCNWSYKGNRPEHPSPIQFVTVHFGLRVKDGSIVSAFTAAGIQVQENLKHRVRGSHK